MRNVSVKLHGVFNSKHNVIFNPPSVINYEITVVTGDVIFSGTNAKVFIQIYGDKGKTEVLNLESRSDNLERDSTDIFKVIYFFPVLSLEIRFNSEQNLKANLFSGRGQRRGENI